MGKATAWVIGIVVIIGMLVGGAVYGVKTSNDKYYEAMNLCISSGGSWIPSIGNSGACIRK